MSRARRLAPGLEPSERVVVDDPLAGSDDLWADEDLAFATAEEPVLVPHPDSVAFFRGFLLAGAVSLVLWLVLAGLGFAVYRLLT